MSNRDSGGHTSEALRQGLIDRHYLKDEGIEDARKLANELFASVDVRGKPRQPLCEVEELADLEELWGDD